MIFLAGRFSNGSAASRTVSKEPKKARPLSSVTLSKPRRLPLTTSPARARIGKLCGQFSAFLTSNARNPTIETVGLSTPSASQNRLRYNSVLNNDHRDFTTGLPGLGMGSPARPRLVCSTLRHTDGATTTRLAEHSGSQNHANLRSHRFRKNAGGILNLH